jgi:hypothetical protein
MVMLACPKCHGTEINETTRQVPTMRMAVAEVLQRSIKFFLIGIIIGTAIIAVIVTTVASANGDAVGRFLAMGVGLVVFVGLLGTYLKNSGMRTMHVYTCAACRKTWCEIAQNKS